MHAVDTNVIVRFLTRDDANQARRALALLLSREIWVPKTVILETEWVLRRLYGYSTEQVCDALKAMIGLPIVQLEDSASVTQALEWHSHGLDFADALHLASRPSGAETFMTFDERLVKKAKLLGIHGVRLP